MRKVLKSLTMTEWLIWSTSVLSIILSFFIFKNDKYHYLIGSVIGVTGLIFVAKGNLLGHVFSIGFCVIYGIISYSFAYYGEMITYLGMSLPLSIWGLIAWLRNPYKGKALEVKLKSIENREWMILFVSGTCTALAFFFLLEWLNTANLIISTVSVFTSFAAAFLSAKRSRFYAIAYCFNDLVLIYMWVLATLEDMRYMPMVVCFAAFLVNDIYGFINWTRMRKRQKKEEESKQR